MPVVRRKIGGEEAGNRSSKDRMLDAAEHLFARHGFDGVSVATSRRRQGPASRQSVITSAANANSSRRCSRGAPKSSSPNGLRCSRMCGAPRFPESLRSRRSSLPSLSRCARDQREVMPDCPPQEIYWRYQFPTGALTLTFAQAGRIDKPSGGPCRSCDLDDVHQRLARHVAAGFRALNAAALEPGAATEPAASIMLRRNMVPRKPTGRS
jgi:tetracycline repressor-like protein